MIYYTLVKIDMPSFKDSHPLSERKLEANRIFLKYPTRIPIISEQAPGSKLPALDKKKYLVPNDLTFGQFVYVIRKRIQLPADQAIYIFVNGVLPPPSALVSEIHKLYADEDRFLYCQYSSESTFG
jgi:GABA(A) receptor-associated protein